MILYRPVGLKELELIVASGWRAFPPRLDWQPIFYPVLTIKYARKICVDWNTRDVRDSGAAGFVTEFEVDDAFLSRYPVQQAGGRACCELWVPAEELAEFNRHIVGTIRVIESHYGTGFSGEIDPASQLPMSITRAR